MFVLKLNNSPRYIKCTFHKNKKSSTKLVHRVVWESFNGKTSLQVDHIIEGNKLDNRLCNLQALTNRENSIKYKKTKTNKTSKYIGVSFNAKTNKWEAKLGFSYRDLALGSSETEEGAYEIYKQAYNKYVINGEELPPIRTQSSNHTGVSFNKKISKWWSYINVFGKVLYLGAFNTEQEAKDKYDKANLKYIVNKEPLPIKKVKVGQYKGVSFHSKNKVWQTSYANKYIGSYKTEAEAFEAREKYIKQTNK